MALSGRVLKVWEGDMSLSEYWEMTLSKECGCVLTGCVFKSAFANKRSVFDSIYGSENKHHEWKCGCVFGAYREIKVF